MRPADLQMTFCKFLIVATIKTKIKIKKTITSLWYLAGGRHMPGNSREMLIFGLGFRGAGGFGYAQPTGDGLVMANIR